MDKLKIKHIHLNQCQSTQLELEEYADKFLDKNPSNIVISTSIQNKGVGRQNNQWDQYPKSLAFSFIITPNEISSLTPLEIGVLTVMFFRSFFAKELKLKWPNDILTTDGNKCGGILCKMRTDGLIMTGMGLNTIPIETNLKKLSYKIPAGFIFRKDETLDANIVTKLYNFILENRLNPNETIKFWNQDCIHIDKTVSIENDQQRTIGTFKGIGSIGEAILEKSSGEEELIFAGSLFIAP